MLQDRASRRIAILVTLLIVAVAAVVVVVAGAGGPSGVPAQPRARIASVRAVDRHQSTIGRIDGPGYIAWVGAWEMPGGALMTGYTQAEAQGDPSARARAPKAVLARFGFTDYPPERDFWGLDLTVRYQQSDDGGRTWRLVRSDPFKALVPVAYSQQATAALPDGTI